MTKNHFKCCFCCSYPPTPHAWFTVHYGFINNPTRAADQRMIHSKWCFSVSSATLYICVHIQDIRSWIQINCNDCGWMLWSLLLLYNFLVTEKSRSRGKCGSRSAVLGYSSLHLKCSHLKTLNQICHQWHHWPLILNHYLMFLLPEL